MNTEMNNQLVIYKNKSGQIEIDVKVEKETIWLTQKQISKLFDKGVPAINEHIKNIFKEKELDDKSVIRKFRITASDNKTYNTNFYNLDLILSVGYRVNSKKATNFRIWATKTLREFLIQGYVFNEKRLSDEKNKLKQLQEAINFIEKKSESYLLRDKTKELFALLGDYTKALTLLREYDDDKIKIGKKSKPIFELCYKDCQDIIRNAKNDQKFSEKDLFGSEYKGKLDSIIGAINQTFDGIELYKSIEEKAANLLYLVIKDHPFADGNKRIGSILFLYYLERNDFLYKDYERKVNNTSIVALALLVAVSDPKDKDVLVKIIISLLQ